MKLGIKQITNLVYDVTIRQSKSVPTVFSINSLSYLNGPIFSTGFGYPIKNQLNVFVR
jgi:hypothetical protein